MKRFGALLTGVFLSSMIAGCDGGGIKEGSPDEPVTSTQTNEFREAMKGAGNKMLKKQMGKKSADPPKKAPEKEAEKTAP